MKRSINSELNKALAPIRRRIILKSVVRMAVLGVLIVLFQGLIWLIVSFFIPVFDLEVKMGVIGGIIFITALAAGVVMKPSMARIAREADELGLEERVITALELSDREDIFAQLQRQDAIEKLRSFNPKSMPVRISKNQWISMGSLALALFAFLLIPNPQNEFIRQQAQVEKAIQKQLEKLEEQAEEGLADDAELTDEEREGLRDLLKELAQKLREARDYREAIKEVTRSEEQLAEMLRKAQESKMAELGEKLSEQQRTQSLGQMVKEMDEQGIAEEMEKLKEIVRDETMDREIMEALQKALEEAAKQLADSNLKSSMMEAANAIASDLASGNELAAQALEALEGQIMQMAQHSLNDSQNIMYMLQNMKGQISEAAGQDISNLAWAEGAEEGQQGTQQGNESQSDGNSSGDQGNSSTGSQGEQGSSESGSSGQGNSGTAGNSGNSGENGSGAGTSGTSAGGGQDAGIGSGHTEYEKIYDPQRLGNGGESSQISGNTRNGGDSEQINAGQGLGDFNGFIPYNEVLGEYESQAMQNLERMDIPPNMRELIKGYFSSLGE